MADKTAFTPDEWSRVLGSVMLTGMAVTLSDQSGLWGMLKESMAGTGALLGADNDAEANPLVKAIAAEFKTSEGRGAAQASVKSVFSGATSPADAQARAVAALRDVASLVAGKAPGDAPAFSAWLQGIGERTANAANEGGFLGFGGVAVSDAEKAMLQQIATALGGKTV